ncbi:hypothetical protein D3C84_1276830 [compost metagenome]
MMPGELLFDAFSAPSSHGQPQLFVLEQHQQAVSRLDLNLSRIHEKSRHTILDYFLHAARPGCNDRQTACHRLHIN